MSGGFLENAGFLCSGGGGGGGITFPLTVDTVITDTGVDATFGGDILSAVSGTSNIGAVGSEFGDFLLNGDITQNEDSPTTNIFGRCRIDNRASDNAYFSHYDRDGVGEFSVRQDASGRTFINGGLGGAASVIIGHNQVGAVEYNTVSMFSKTAGSISIGKAGNEFGDFLLDGDITQNADTDTTNIFGKVRIDSRVSGSAFFSEHGFSTSVNFALRQNGGTGAVAVNAPSGQNVSLAQSGSDKVVLNAEEFFSATDGEVSLGKVGGKFKEAHLAGDGTNVFYLPTDNIDPTGGGGAATGRIPVDIGGATLYIPYY